MENKWPWIDVDLKTKRDERGPKVQTVFSNLCMHSLHAHNESNKSVTRIRKRTSTCQLVPATDSTVNHGKIGRPENAVHTPHVMNKQCH